MSDNYAIFASGESVLDVDLKAVKYNNKIVTTNYPISLIDNDVVSDYHSVGDLETIIFANNYFTDDTKVFIRNTAFNRYRKYYTKTNFEVIDIEKYLYYETTFLLTIQHLYNNYDVNELSIYGLDFKTGKYIKWYDKYLTELDLRKKPKTDRKRYNYKMIEKTKGSGSTSDNFKKQFIEWYDKYGYKKKIKFFGFFQKP